MGAAVDRKNDHPSFSSFSVLFALQVSTFVAPKVHQGTQGVIMNSQGAVGYFTLFEGTQQCLTIVGPHANC